MFKLNGEQLSTCNTTCHLGHVLKSNTEGFFDIDHVVNSFNRSVNLLMAEVGYLQSDLLYKLFIQYCCSMYGVNLCDVNSTSFNKLYTAWRKAMRRVHRLPYMAHNYIVNLLAGKFPISYQTEYRIMKYLTHLMSSDNKLLVFIAKSCMYHSNSNMGKNVSYFMLKYHSCHMYNLLTDTNVQSDNRNMSLSNMLHEHFMSTVTSEDSNTAEMCKELLMCRDNTQHFVLNQQECIDLLNFICTN